MGCLEEYPDLRLAGMTADDLADLQLVDQANNNNTGSSSKDKDKDASAAKAAASVDDEELAAASAPQQTSGSVTVPGNLATFVQRLEEEYTKSLQKINPHTAEYILRLKDESALVALAAAIQAYYARIGSTEEAASVALLQVEHMYYKHDSIAHAVHRSQAFTNVYGAVSCLHPACLGSAGSGSDWSVTHPAAVNGKPDVQVAAPDYAAEIQSLCVYLYKHGDDRAKTRAMLCHISHHALHDRSVSHSNHVYIRDHMNGYMGMQRIALS